MTTEEAIKILDPETRQETLKAIPVFKRIDIDQEACRLAVAALRAQLEAEKNEPPTNADRIQSMSAEELATFLAGVAYSRETPWSDPFYNNLCKQCPIVECVFETGEEMKLHECDFADKCPHGSDIVWWLGRPVEEETQ